MKKSVIEALNRAIVAYTKNGGRVCSTDVVVDYNLDILKVATLNERHPGSLLMPVQLKEGSGYFFLGWTVQCGLIFPQLAWEEDNSMHSIWSLFRNEEGKMRDDNGSTIETARGIVKELRTIIENFLILY
jgi:hypothetical protein